MINLIREIVEMDRKAREITDAAQAEKVNSEKEVAQKREEIRKEHLEKARRRINENEPKVRAEAERKWLSVQAEHEAYSHKMEALYREKADEWVRAIVARVIEG